MSRALHRLGYLMYLKRWSTLAVWMLILVIAGILGFQWQAPLSKDFAIPSLPSSATRSEMDRFFPPSPPAQGNSAKQEPAPAPEQTLNETIVVRVPEGQKLSDPHNKTKLDQLRTDLGATGAIRGEQTVDGPYEEATTRADQIRREMAGYGVPASVIEQNAAAVRPISPDERVGIFELAIAKSSNPDQGPKAVQRVLDQANSPDFEVAYQGDAIATPNSPLASGAELLGLLVAAAVLFVALGAIPASIVPIISALVSVGLSAVCLLAQLQATSSTNFLTPVLMAMIGLAVGIDYALFIIARFRNEVFREIGHNAPGSEFRAKFQAMSHEQRANLMGVAVAKAGAPVIFAGLTVFIALLSLTIVGIPFLSAMAQSAAIGVALAVLVSLTFLPALAAAMGKHLFRMPPPALKVPDPENDSPTVGLKWIRIVRAHPKLFLVLAISVLGICATPAAQLQLAMPSHSSAPLGTPERRSADMIAEGFGPGHNAPMVALVDTTKVPAYQRKTALMYVLTDMNSVEGVRNVLPSRATKDLSGVQLLITTEYAASDPRAAETMNRLRTHATQLQHTNGITYGITGMTPVFVDLSTILKDSLIPYALMVIGLAILVLIGVFRSLWIPLVAALGFGLSVAATFGLTVAFFQFGAFGLVADPQPIISFLPVILIGLTFGLAMDYQVFLVSRMREGWLAGKAAGDAVSNGFKHGARVVTAAALIMISVFGSFISHDQMFIKTMGFALATAVLLDAFIVRMTIIPATLFLLGERAWRFPFAPRRRDAKQPQPVRNEPDDYRCDKPMAMSATATR